MNFWKQYRETVRDNIRNYGWHLQGVFPTREDPPETMPFLYTVGLSEKSAVGFSDEIGIELLIIGRFDHRLMGGIANAIGRYIIDNNGIDDFDRVHDIGWTVGFKFRKCGPRAKTEYTIQAGGFVGDYEVVQILLVDKNGIWQNEPGCEFDEVDFP